MEEDILNYSPTAMFRGTPCIFKTRKLNLMDHHLYGLELFERINNCILNHTFKEMILQHLSD